MMPTTTTTTTTEAPTTTTEPPEIPDFLINCRGGSTSQPLRPHPLDCTKFYTCNWIEGAFVVKVEKCKDDKVFVQDKQECIEASKAPECKNETIATTEESELRRCEQVIENHRRNKPFVMDPKPQFGTQTPRYPPPNNGVSFDP